MIGKACGISGRIERIQESWKGLSHESSLCEEVAKGNRQTTPNRARLRPDRRTQVGQAVLHFSEEERGDRDPAQRVVRVLFLQGRTAQGPQADSPNDRTGTGGPLD